MERYLVKVKISKFAQFYITNRKELEIIKQLDYYNEGGCCGQSQCVVCKLGGCRFKYLDDIEITDKNEELIDFVDDAQYYTLSNLIDITKEQDDYDDGAEFYRLVQMIGNKDIQNIGILTNEFYFDASEGELAKIN
uniref:Uncharacterized protein n=1 Tax=viral metagenome TaxID=1070528 RepID=A0A6C0CC19_9ZZZZ